MNEETTKDNDSNFDRAARVFVEEVRKYGFSCDTMASERLHKLTERLQEIGQDKAASRIENLDRFPDHGRRDAEIYALLAIGRLWEGRGELIDLFRMGENA